MARRDPGPPRGIVLDARGRPFRQVRVGPTAELARWVRHFWIVEWDLDAPHVQEVLPHPAAHLALERGSSRIVGVMLDRFRRELAGRGMVLGIALRPAMLRCFTGEPAWKSRGRMEPLTLLWPDARELERAVLDAPRDEERVAITERWMLDRRPAIDPDAERVASIVESIERDRALTRAEDLAAREGLELRALQRLFRAWIGVTPKWVIQRYRIHEALERVASEGGARIAAELGYTDQAHFAKHFKKLVGRTPTEHAQLVRRSR